MTDEVSLGADFLVSSESPFAGKINGDVMSLRALSQRQPKLCARLRKFGFPQVARLAAGLLTIVDHHPATYRIEALIHLAAMHCRGDREPTLAQIREWLNDVLLGDAIGQGEDPIEDVFVSVVPSFAGTTRLFEGAWADSSQYLGYTLTALLHIPEQGWTRLVLRRVMALLRLSEAVAERAGVARYSVSAGRARAPVRAAATTVGAGQAAVSFTVREMLSLGLAAHELAPFVFTPGNIDALQDESLGHTALERRPLLRDNAGWLVTLPTAISAAARRYVLESARDAGALSDLERAIGRVQLRDWTTVGMKGWELGELDEPREIATGLTGLTAKFGEGAYAVVVVTNDNLEQVLSTGLQSIDAHQPPPESRASTRS